MKTRKFTINLIVGTSLGLFSFTSAHAATVFTQALPDTEKFKCKYCPEAEEKVKELELGLGLNTEKSAKFSEYNGQDGNHLLPLIDGKFLLVTDENQYYSLQSTNLGLTSREIELGFGEFGDYAVTLNYDQITRFQYEGMDSEFVGDTSDQLTQSASLKSIDFRQERYRFSTSLKKVFSNKWSGVVDYRFENKQGTRPISAAMYTSYIDARAAMLSYPIDQVTQQLKVSALYHSTKLSLEAGIKTSFFSNSIDDLQWENPFTYDPGGSAIRSDSGRLALAPDNQHLQLFGLGSLRLNSWIKAKGQLAIGQQTQNEEFLPYTVNSALVTTDLPRKSLNGKVTTITGNMRLTVNPFDNAEINANLYGDRKDNKTPMSSYEYVVLDTLTTSLNTRTNSPYTYRKYGADLNASYNYKKRDKVTLGYKYQQQSRTYSDVGKTKENEVWLLNNTNIDRYSSAKIRLSQSTRTANKYENIQPSQPDEMRKYYLADRKRLKAKASVSTSAIQNVSLSAYLSYALDDYTDSKLGLEEATELAYGIDASTFIDENIVVSGFLSKEKLNSIQNGASGTFQWRADNMDNFTTLGLSAEWQEFTEKSDIGINYQISMASSEIETKTSSGTEALPDMTTDRHTLELYTRYNYDETLQIKGSYVFENYSDKDWHVDDLDFNSVTNLRGMPYQTQSYTVHFLMASMIYRF